MSFLAGAAPFEFYSWRISYRELCRRKDTDESVFDEIIGSKDPTIFTIFLEDSAGLIGAAIAFLGIWLGRMFQNPFLDPAASILIGVLLAAVAVLLGRETGALLVGERTNRSRIDRVRRIIKNDPDVEQVGELLTMQMGPQEALLTAEIRFLRSLNIQQIESAIGRIKGRVREKESALQRIFIDPEPFPRKRDQAA